MKTKREVDPAPLADWIHNNMKDQPKNHEQNFNIYPFTSTEREEGISILKQNGYHLVAEGNNLLVRKY